MTPSPTLYKQLFATILHHSFALCLVQIRVAFYVMARRGRIWAVQETLVALKPFSFPQVQEGSLIVCSPEIAPFLLLGCILQLSYLITMFDL